jgi:hypothetical protein
MTFLNVALLLGLVAAVVPVLIHWFSRTRYDEVDWAAMQFLEPDPATTRRTRIDRWLLLACRTTAIGLLAVALAAPASRGVAWSFARGSPRDVAIVVDVSESMGLGEPVPVERAKAWCRELLGTLRPGDRVAVLAARQSTVAVVPPWDGDFARASAMLDTLPATGGRADLPAAIAQAVAAFDDANRTRQLVVLTDDQANGKADPATRARWSSLAIDPAIRVGIVALPTSRPTTGLAISLEPLRTTRTTAIAGHDIGIRTSVIRRNGPLPATAKLTIDGRAAGTVPIAADGAISVSRSWPAGSHVVTVEVGAVAESIAVNVLPAIPVLIVTADGERERLPFAVALAPARDPTPSFVVKAIPVRDLTPLAVANDLAGPGTPPRVVALLDVPKLTFDQNRTIEAFVQSGGGVLVAPGRRFDAAAWNSLSLRGGQGWLPGRIDASKEPTTIDLSRHPHPLTAPFRESSTLAAARGPQSWRLDATAVPGAVPAGGLANGRPLFVERPFGRGRALASAIPLDGRDGSNLATLPDYVRLIRDATTHLAGGPGRDANLTEGQPIVWTPFPAEPPAGVTVTGPDGASRLVPCAAWPFVWAETGIPGIYRLTSAGGRSRYAVVRGDPGERDLTPMTDSEKVGIAGVSWIAEPSEVRSLPTADAAKGATVLQEWWWLPLVVAIVLLLIEPRLSRKH